MGSHHEVSERGGDAIDVVGVLGADAEREQLPGRAVDDLQLPAAVDAAEAVQKGRTSDLVFPVPALIAELSAVVPLEPGDIIFTGTPAGVGAARHPPRYLAAGEELVSWIEGIGEMRHRLVAPADLMMGAHQ